ncbi:hypothetical protein ACHAXT_007488 [Thalassiosira profunda]
MLALVLAPSDGRSSIANIAVMLTSWKSTRTSLECAGEPHQTKRKRPRTSTTTSTIDEEHIIGAHFIQALSNTHPSHGKSNDPSSKKKAKRRKAGRDGTARAGDDPTDVAPRLCLTSPHRVVFLGDQRGEGDGALVESASRNYVARPGAPSRFALGNGEGSEDGAFQGMVPPGAQYDPASNLVYALRNGGREVAIWSAAPCSVLRGPDDGASAENGAANGKKRKSYDRRHGNDSDEGIVSCRLELPGGKVAVTLSPFGIARKGHQLAASGAAGCCADGSIWVVARFGTGDFRLLMVEGSSVAEEDANGGTAGKKRGSKSGKGRGGGKGASYDEGKGTFQLAVHSVIASDGDGEREVSFRNHRVIVHNKEGCDAKNPSSLASIEKHTRQHILTLEQDEGRDVGVQLDAGAKSLSIVHKKAGGNGGWMYASVDVSLSKGALLDTLSAFPIPSNDGASGAVFSFGRVSDNAVAVLTKSEAGEASAMDLRVIDICRKVELASLSLHEMLQGKACHGMLTNEQDGSIALLLTPLDQEKDSMVLEVVSSKLDASSADLDAVDSTATKASSNGTSLASALRLLATAAPRPVSDRLSKRPSEGNLGNVLSNGNDCSNSDHAVNEACNLLSALAIELINDLNESVANSGEKVPTMNGKSRKGGAKRGKKKAKPLSSWKDAYISGKELIAKVTRGDKSDGSKTLINGIKGNAKTAPKASDSMPKRFVETAFRETATILLSLHKAKDTPEAQEAIQDATAILVDVLQSNLISGRDEYGIKLPRGNVLLAILQASSFGTDNAPGKLHLADAMLGNVRDMPERVLLSILRYVLRSVEVEDAVAYYSTSTAARGAKLCSRYKESNESQEDGEAQVIGTKLLAEAVLDFTSKVVSYSNCNQSFLTKAMRSDVHASSEVETLLLAMAKLLKQGSKSPSVGDSDAARVGVTVGTIQWISALTDAHMPAILKMADEGSLVLDKLQSAVRSAMAQSDLAKEVQDMTNMITTNVASANRATKAAAPRSSDDTTILPYTIERLAF